MSESILQSIDCDSAYTGGVDRLVARRHWFCVYDPGWRIHSLGSFMLTLGYGIERRLGRCFKPPMNRWAMIGVPAGQRPASHIIRNKSARVWPTSGAVSCCSCSCPGPSRQTQASLSEFLSGGEGSNTCHLDRYLAAGDYRSSI